MTSTPQLLDATQVDPAALDDFLRTVYPPVKCDFLRSHGAWWHGSEKNRLVIEVDDRIAGYCAVIPARVMVAGRVRSALWWVDLVIAPGFRGQGLQTLFDQAVRDMADLLIGFPNELAAKIHRKHHWGVRADQQILLLPLQPARVKPLQRLEGMRGRLVRTAAWGLTPLSLAWRAWLRLQNPVSSWKLEKFDAALPAGVFARFRDVSHQTTWRDEDYFDWRYGQVPAPREYAFYFSGPRLEPSHFLIARHLTQPDGLRYTRILDLYGNFNDLRGVRDLFVLALRDAISHGSSQVTVLASDPRLLRIVRRLGFVISAPVMFCWLSRDRETMAAFEGPIVWSLADSDNDAPD